MCGIAGVVGVSALDRRAPMLAMREQLTHRGPDSGGEHVDAHAALGVRRLRVIDLVTGEQPQSNEDGSVTVVHNGEIYNYRELRDELAARGHRFATASDTEVIVHLYEDHGEGFATRLEGMFAIALWDATRRTLVLARDRMGKKPLLYRDIGDELHFASEHAALLAGAAERPPVDHAAIATYLRLGYVPTEMDAFVGVHKLPPAHVLVWRDGRSSLRRYWDLPAPGSSRLSEDEAVEELRRLLRCAVQRRLVADVPLGAFLSGGVDSSAVVATMASLTDRVRTFTIDFREAHYSEAMHARRVAKRYGTDHHELVVEHTDLDVIPLLACHYGEPYADSSAIPTYYLSKLTREHVTVALNGDGADELFGGYDRYRAMAMSSALGAIPRPVRALALAVGARAIPSSMPPTSAAGRARRFLDAAALAPRERYLAWVSIFDDAQLRWLSPELASDGATLAAAAFLNGATDPVVAAQLFDLRRYLPDDLLVKVDIASMANSLEVRSPFLDRDIVEFAVRLPTRHKIRGGAGKHVLRRALEGIVPRENLERRKHGFGVPVGAWLRGAAAPFARDLLLSDRARSRGYFRADAVEALLNEHARGAVDHGARLWALVMLEAWHRGLVDA